MRVLRWINNSFAKLETLLILIILIFMIGLAFTQIILRLSGHGLMWSDVVLRHIALWIGFLGAGLAAKEGRHINIDIMSKLLPPKAQVYVRLVVNLGSSFICALLVKAALSFQDVMKQETGSPFWGVPAWVVTIIVPIGFAVIGMRFLFIFFEDLAGLIAGGTGTGIVDTIEKEEQL